MKAATNLVQFWSLPSISPYAASCSSRLLYGFFASLCPSSAVGVLSHCPKFSIQSTFYLIRPIFALLSKLTLTQLIRIGPFESLYAMLYHESILLHIVLSFPLYSNLYLSNPRLPHLSNLFVLLCHVLSVYPKSATFFSSFSALKISPIYYPNISELYSFCPSPQHNSSLQPNITQFIHIIRRNRLRILHLPIDQIGRAHV